MLMLMHERVVREAGQLHDVLVFVWLFGCCWFFFFLIPAKMHSMDCLVGNLDFEMLLNI